MSSLTNDSSSHRETLRASLWVYPWDIVDEGVEVAFQRAKMLARADVMKVAVTYHAGLLLLPHNPSRHVYATEDGVLYFRADGEDFPSGLQPTLSEVTFGDDPLRLAEVGAREHGMGLRAWVVCCHNSRLGLARPDLTVLNALGDRLPFALCPSQTEVQEYLLALVQSLNRYSGLDAIELEALYWLPARHAWHHPKFGFPLGPMAEFLLGLCCCPACVHRAGVCPNALNEELRPLLLAAMSQADSPMPLDRAAVEGIGENTASLVKAREHTLTELLESLARATRFQLHAMVGSGIVRTPWVRGIDLAGWSRAADSMVVNTYHADPAVIAADLTAFRSAAAQAPLIVGLDATHPVTTSVSSLTDQTMASFSGGPDELSFYNYGLLTLPRLEWVGQSLDAARRTR